MGGNAGSTVMAPHVRQELHGFSTTGWQRRPGLVLRGLEIHLRGYGFLLEEMTLTARLGAD